MASQAKCAATHPQIFHIQSYRRWQRNFENKTVDTLCSTLYAYYIRTQDTKDLEALINRLVLQVKVVGGVARNEGCACDQSKQEMYNYEIFTVN